VGDGVDSYTRGPEGFRKDRRTGMLEPLARLRDNISKVLFGNSEAIERACCCLLARGHLLIEDVPGVGKTVLATALARSVDCTFARIQLTPDMLPSDVLGVSIYDKASGEFTYKRGPIFSNIVLADEINRTPPRTQSALLEAMNEGTVSVDGRILPLDQPFMVVATQNPFDFEGTYLLPENQLDRFLMRISLGYPSPEEEARVLDVRPANHPLHDLKPVLTRAELMELQARVDAVKVDRALLDYIVRFANATRGHTGLLHGLSPRGSLSLAQAARAMALFKGRGYVVPDDIVDNIVPVCAHRVVTRSAGSSSDGAQRVLREVLQGVASPA
jgi:MoxR-like ATPase